MRGDHARFLDYHHLQAADVVWSAAMMGDIHQRLRRDRSPPKRDFLLEELLDLGLYDSIDLPQGSWEERSFRYSAATSSALYDHISCLEDNLDRSKAATRIMCGRLDRHQLEVTDRLLAQERSSSAIRSGLLSEIQHLQERVDALEERSRFTEDWVGRTEERLDQVVGEVCRQWEDLGELDHLLVQSV